MRISFVKLLCAALAAAWLPRLTSAEEVEVRARLHSYGLMIPKPSYCCEFQVAIAPTGDVNLKLVVPDRDGIPEDVAVSYTAEKQDLAAIRKALDDSQFFDLPNSVELLTGWHPEYREMEVRLGERSHRVKLVIPGSCVPGEEAFLEDPSQEERALVRRACRVWQAIRAVVKEPRLTLE